MKKIAQLFNKDNAWNFSISLVFSLAMLAIGSSEEIGLFNNLNTIETMLVSISVLVPTFVFKWWLVDTMFS